GFHRRRWVDRKRSPSDGRSAILSLTKHGLRAFAPLDRRSHDDVAALLRNQPDAVAILHSFSSGPALCRTAVELGHYVSWSGMITFRNWTSDALVRSVPPDRLLIETDAPYLAPVPHRSHRNEPALVRRVAERLAEVLGRTFEEIAELTTANAVRLFGTRLQTSQEAS
ncbi:MAG: TatD family hydrolase, partial [Gemmatimonadota bacterium]